MILLNNSYNQTKIRRFVVLKIYLFGHLHYIIVYLRIICIDLLICSFLLSLEPKNRLIGNIGWD
jgi:hypothetical protein